MQNPILRSVGGLLRQANEAIAGLTAYAATLNLVAVPVGALTAAVNAFSSSNAVFNAERTQLGNRRAESRDMTESAIDFVSVTRDVLKPRLGKKHSFAWIQAGFPTSLEVPRSVDKLLPLLTSLAAHLGANPTHQNADLNVIAARATTFVIDLTNARNAVNAQKTKMANALKERQTQGAIITRMLRNMIKELSIHLDPLDNRYTTFGLNRPGQLRTPEKPQNVVVVSHGPGGKLIKWDKAPRAEHYRIWARVVGGEGVEGEMGVRGTAKDLDFVMEDVPPGITLEIAVSAVNNGGESALSEVVRISTG